MYKYVSWFLVLDEVVVGFIVFAMGMKYWIIGESYGEDVVVVEWGWLIWIELEVLKKMTKPNDICSGSG